MYYRSDMSVNLQTLPDDVLKELLLLEEQKKKLIAGIVLTGGGSQLKHLKQLVEYITGMDTRIGYPNEHLGKGDRPEIESPMYATAIGLLMKGIVENEKKPTAPIPTEKPGDPTEAPINEVGGPKKTESTPELEEDLEPSSSFFDKWVKGFIKFLANED